MPIMFGWRDARGCARMACGWFADGLRMVCGWCADGLRTKRWRGALRARMVCGWFADGLRMVCGWCLDDGGARRPRGRSSADGKKGACLMAQRCAKTCSPTRTYPPECVALRCGWDGGWRHKTRAHPTRAAVLAKRCTRGCDARAHLALDRALCHRNCKVHRHAGWSQLRNCVCICEDTSGIRCAVPVVTICNAQRIARAKLTIGCGARPAPPGGYTGMARQQSGCDMFGAHTRMHSSRQRVIVLLRCLGRPN